MLVTFTGVMAANCCDVEDYGYCMARTLLRQLKFDCLCCFNIVEKKKGNLRISKYIEVGKPF